MLPLSIDALLQNTSRQVLCYAITWRILSIHTEYLMVGFHDYDLTTPQLRRSIERYVARVSEFTNPVSVDDIETAPEKQNY